MAVDTLALRARAAHVGDNALTLEMVDGRTVTAPLAWYPRLLAGTLAERATLELSGQGEGVHWPDLDEDLSIESVLAGRSSAEHFSSFQRWLSARSAQSASE